MMIRPQILLLALLPLAGCEVAPVVTDAQSAAGNVFVSPVPESVVAVAAPFQNLDRVVFLETDRCYWYEHDGPVETTLLPLRTRNGVAICAAREAAAAPT